MVQGMTLYELNGLVRQTLELTLDEEYWVQAEIAELRVNRHCYMELVQKETRGGGIVAKSDEEYELQEVNNKLGALRRAIIMAEKM